ncbi:hypothetical protein [Nitrosophilus labii]|uniref:hypothetical protein n=1 Tax=Nitrosophilus labii TaxID=2706014 RepID=UPI001657188B|nr:hypothetical protein [Nitrosophilus labii]
MKSVVSYPDRGKWGKNSWRGNTSGYIIKDLIEHFKPSLFVDVCEGSGTSGDVCREMGVEYIGLDLYKGQDFTKDYILSFLPRPADICFSHPPYHSMIRYSGSVWGKCPVEGDTSHCKSVDEFLEKSQVMLLNQREATKDGGIYTTLIGDMRKNGSYRSFQADFIGMMPKNELLNVVIKVQHNMMSNKTHYSGKFIPIVHEYLLIWRKSAKSLFAIAWDTAKEIKRQVASTWRSAIRIALMKLGGQASLQEIYREVENIAQHLISKNRNWRAKIRQQLQYHFRNVQRGVWAM